MELITETDKKDVKSFTEHALYRKWKELGKNASNLQIVEAATTDLRERQYHTLISSGSSPEEAGLESGWSPEKK